jgi:hypothetical protein
MALSLFFLIACFALGAAYIALGIAQMVVPMHAIKVYRYFIGTRRYSALREQWPGVRRMTNKIIGAGYICFGLLLIWACMHTAQQLLNAQH